MPDAPARIDLRLSPRRVAIALLGIAVALTALSVPASYYLLTRGKLATGADTVSRFHLDRERGLSACFAAAMLLGSAGLLWLHARAARLRGQHGLRLGFAGLAAVFALLCLDELCGFHELAGRFMQSRLQWTGWLRFTWVVVAVPAVALLGLVHIPFLRALPGRIALQVLIAGLLYVGGAAGVEVLSAKVFSDNDQASSALYEVLVHVEEVLEMLGMIVFIHALLLLHAMWRSTCRIDFTDADAMS